MSGRMVTAQEARGMRDAATTGPWRWSNTGEVYLQGARSKIVMAFRRMGMNGAQPQMIRHPHERLVLDDVGRANLNDYPDARLIAAAPDLADTVVQQAEQIAAVLALHTHGPLIKDGVTTEVCDVCALDVGTDATGIWQPYPCPTARELGVES